MKNISFLNIFGSIWLISKSMKVIVVQELVISSWGLLEVRRDVGINAVIVGILFLGLGWYILINEVKIYTHELVSFFRKNMKNLSFLLFWTAYILYPLFYPDVSGFLYYFFIFVHLLVTAVFIISFNRYLEKRII